MYLQSHCFYKIGYASSRLYRRRFLDFLLYRRKQEQTTTTFSNNRFDFFRTPLQQQTEPPTTFSCCQQHAEGLVRKDQASYFPCYDIFRDLLFALLIRRALEYFR